jgi:hypothetical protein
MLQFFKRGTRIAFTKNDEMLMDRKKGGRNGANSNDGTEWFTRKRSGGY